MPAVISFTVETDGRLPSGQRPRRGHRQVDAATGAAPAYYMINCAHPTHFESVVDAAEPWAARIRGLRANASKQEPRRAGRGRGAGRGRSGRPRRRHAALRDKLPRLTVLGGCCGTDDRHVREIIRAVG